MLRLKLLHLCYRILRPLIFTQDAEKLHNFFSDVAEKISSKDSYLKGFSLVYSYQDTSLKQNIEEIEFENPIGLSAGYDYDGHMAEFMKSLGFGFNTVGTVTAKPYEGNQYPRLGRLPKSKALLVNKGFKSEGAKAVAKRLDGKNLMDKVVGVSVGSSNLPEVNTINKAIDDYLITFETFKDKSYLKYFELNISCPNTAMTEGFANEKNFKDLVHAVSKLKINKPIFVKMANEIEHDLSDKLVKIGIESGMSGFIFSNLVKDRSNVHFNKDEIDKIQHLKGNFGGKPAKENSNKLISHNFKKFGKDTIIIGCGGVFTAEDAYEKIKLGASLVQMITGLIYEGPQVVSEINEGLVKLLKTDGYKNIKEVVGTGIK